STLGVTDALAAEVMEAEPRVNWGPLSTHVTHQAGGGRTDDTQRILEWLRQFAIEPPSTVFVPPSRNLLRQDGAAGAGWDFGGTGILAKLHEMKNPEFDDAESHRQSQALTRDLRALLDDDELEWVVPSKRDTLNIRLRGTWFPLQLLGTGTEHAI